MHALLPNAHFILAKFYVYLLCNTPHHFNVSEFAIALCNSLNTLFFVKQGFPKSKIHLTLTLIIPCCAVMAMS